MISPDSERVLFYANFSNLAYFDLWSARVDGTGGIVQLTETTADLTDVIVPGISPDSSRVLYFRSLNDNLIQELYSVPSAGGSAVKLNGALTPGGSVWNYRFSPDSTRVVYFAAQQTARRQRALQRADRRRRGDEAQRRDALLDRCRQLRNQPRRLACRLQCQPGHSGLNRALQRAPRRRRR